MENNESELKGSAKTYKTLCAISTALLSLPVLNALLLIICGLEYNWNIGKEAVLYPFLTLVIFGSQIFIASLVFMIIIRIKYPEGTYGKVLMWVIIVLAIIAIVASILFLRACCEDLSHCPG